jgi:hypothetical protein
MKILHISKLRLAFVAGILIAFIVIQVQCSFCLPTDISLLLLFGYLTSKLSNKSTILLGIMISISHFLRE